jgi:hypothetical protein
MSAFAVALTPRLSRARPVPTFRLTNSEAQVFASAAEVDSAPSEETFAAQANDFAYYQLLEQTR